MTDESRPGDDRPADPVGWSIDRDVDGMYVPDYLMRGTSTPVERRRLGSALVDVADVIARAGTTLTPSERRVAEVVMSQPQLVAFGTVVDLADAAGAGAATVVRLAAKLGFDGFTSLQQAVQADLANQLRPAAQRIREQGPTGSVAQHLQLESANLTTTMAALDDTKVGEVVDLLADTTRRVRVVSGDGSNGVARQMVGDLSGLRDEVTLIDGNEVSVLRQASLVRPSDVVMAIDVRRYDRWLVDVVNSAHEAGCTIVAVTDSRLSPLASRSRHTLTVSAVGGGPFESHVGTLALCNLLVAAVAGRLREQATDRLDRAEDAWRRRQALTDG